MGVSANQARLMTLTARLHDLELRAQQISAVKMQLSMQSQSAATEYSSNLNKYGLLKSAEGVSTSSDSKYIVNSDGTFSVSDTGTVSASDLLTTVLGKLDTDATTADSFIAIAKDNYDTYTTSLSSSEKLLDMELTQINTEHEAANTEYDSIKSLISDNVDKSFNVFG